MPVSSLSLADIEAYDPRPSRRGKRLRAKCPIHGGDRQQSLSVDTETGWGRCFACGVVVRVADFQPAEERIENRWRVEGVGTRPAAQRVAPEPPPSSPTPNHGALEKAGEQLPGSPGEVYLADRHIPLTVAQRYDVGYVRKGGWPGRYCARRWPRLTFPLATPEGVTNWYSRAASSEAPRSEAHDVLSGPKGYFHFAALDQNDTVVVVEAPLDGLALAASGCDSFVALIGTHHFRPEWFLAAGVKNLILALDQDEAGGKAAEELVWKAAEVGLVCALLPASVYAGEKDLNAALMKVGYLDLSSLGCQPGSGVDPSAAGESREEPVDSVKAFVQAWQEECEAHPPYPDAD